MWAKSCNEPIKCLVQGSEACSCVYRKEHSGFIFIMSFHWFKTLIYWNLIKKSLIYIGFQRMPSKTKAGVDFRQHGKENDQENCNGPQHRVEKQSVESWHWKSILGKRSLLMVIPNSDCVHCHSANKLRLLTPIKGMHYHNECRQWYHRYLVCVQISHFLSFWIYREPGVFSFFPLWIAPVWLNKAEWCWVWNDCPFTPFAASEKCFLACPPLLSYSSSPAIHHLARPRYVPSIDSYPPNLCIVLDFFKRQRTCEWS